MLAIEGCHNFPGVEIGKGYDRHFCVTELRLHSLRDHDALHSGADGSEGLGARREQHCGRP